MVVHSVPFPFVALTRFSMLSDCVHLSIIDLSDVVADGSIYMEVFHDCIDPAKEIDDKCFNQIFKFTLGRKEVNLSWVLKRDFQSCTKGEKMLIIKCTNMINHHFLQINYNKSDILRLSEN